MDIAVYMTNLNTFRENAVEEWQDSETIQRLWSFSGKDSMH